MRSWWSELLPLFLVAVLPFADSQDSNTLTLVNGQIFTAGLAIIDSPQPDTPEGGDFLQVALDISGDGQIPFPTVSSSSPTLFHNITLFLTSYDTGLNLTISNATGSTAPIANILDQEPSSTVKHVNWLWPSCLVGDGKDDVNASARGSYNISIHQSFRLNNSDFYTITDLPISVTNTISQTPSSSSFDNDPAPGPSTSGNARLNCSQLNNPLISFANINASVHEPSTQPFLGGAIVVSTNSSSSSGSGSTTGSSIFPAVTEGSSKSGQGLGGSATVSCSSSQQSSSETGCGGNGISSNGGAGAWAGMRPGALVCWAAVLAVLVAVIG